MKIKRRDIVVGLVTLTLAYVSIYQNCAGTHERSADFSISTSQVETYISDVQCFASNSSLSTDAVSAINDVSSLEQSSGSELFYAEAPSSMGTIDLVAPLNYSSLRTDGGSTPAQIYAFFVLSPSGTGALTIGVSDSSSTSASPTPATVAQSTVAKQLRGVASASKHVLASTSSSCSSSNPLNLTTTIAAQNDGTLGLETATFGDSTFEMQLNMNGTTLIVRSNDVDSGDLQSTIQLQISEIDSSSGQEVYLGDLNMTQPD
jgi:hypothetical protein